MFQRHQLLMAGLILLLVGVQLRVVETFVFADSASPLIEQVMDPAGADSAVQEPGPAKQSPPRRYRLPIPDWMGWLLLSIGGAVILHSLALPAVDRRT